MKHFLLLSIFILLTIQNCASQLEPAFEKSNQVFLENTIQDLHLSDSLKNNIDINNSIAIVSIENNLTKDEPLTSLIEDYFINDLVRNGYKVYERDLDALINIVRESKNNNYSLSHDQWDYGIQSPLYDSWPEIADTISLTRYDIPDAGFQLYSTQLSSADFVLSYRVLEIGIMYTPIIDNTSIPKEKREGLVRLNYRLQNTATGQVVHAGTLDGNYYDEVRTDQKKSLANYHYSFFGYEYPNKKLWWQKNDNVIVDKALSRAANALAGFIIGYSGKSEGDPLLGLYVGTETTIGKFRLEGYRSEYTTNVKFSMENRVSSMLGKLAPNINSSFFSNILFKYGIGYSRVSSPKEYLYSSFEGPYWVYESPSITLSIGRKFVLGRINMFTHAEANVATSDAGATNLTLRLSVGK